METRGYTKIFAGDLMIWGFVEPMNKSNHCVTKILEEFVRTWNFKIGQEVFTRVYQHYPCHATRPCTSWKNYFRPDSAHARCVTVINFRACFISICRQYVFFPVASTNRYFSRVTWSRNLITRSKTHAREPASSRKAGGVMSRPQRVTYVPQLYSTTSYYLSV